MTRMQTYRDFSWPEYDHYEPDPTIATLVVEGVEVARLETYGPDWGEPDITDLVDDWYEERNTRECPELRVAKRYRDNAKALGRAISKAVGA
jgi:hypothetical protein